ncbi:hypothetical protein ABZX92_12690 [Lentzea sp. NPDC006480]|uniref:hypothetical protein n=1 Tax=Lentzea sp. NPDC006480 TaxID=3157176 RepID=UPI0033B51F2C
MSLPNTCLDVARHAFDLLVAGPHPVSLDGRRFDGLPDRLLPVDELRDLLVKRTCPLTTRDAVWAHLVHQCRVESATWTVAAVGIALPALTTVTARLSQSSECDVGEIHAEVLSGFLQALSTIHLDAPNVLARLRLVAFRAGCRARRELVTSPVPVPPRAPQGHVDLVLAQAVEHGVLSRTEADLIGTTRLDRVPVTEWARRRQIGQWAAYKARQRAEQRLVAHLSDGVSTPELGAVVAEEPPCA